MCVFVYRIVETKIFCVKAHRDWSFSKFWTFVEMFPRKFLLIIVIIIAQPFADGFLVISLSFLDVFKLFLLLFIWFFEKSIRTTM